MKKSLKLISILLILSILFIPLGQMVMADNYEVLEIDKRKVSEVKIHDEDLSFKIENVEKVKIVYEYGEEAGTREYEINKDDKVSNHLYWKDKLFIVKPKQESNIKIIDLKDEVLLKEYKFKDNSLYDIKEDKLIKPEDINSIPEDKPKEDKQAEFKQHVNYPKSNTVRLSTEIIKVAVNKGTLTDVYNNGEVVKTKISSELANIGISIPLKSGLNNITIRSYDDNNEKTFNTVILYNETVLSNQNNQQGGKIEDFELDHSSLLDLDKELESIRNKEYDDDIEIDATAEVYFIFSHDYSKTKFNKPEVVIRGKAVNASKLYVNDNEVPLDEKNNFEFIFRMDEGLNTLKLEGKNESSNQLHFLKLEYEPDKILNIGHFEDKAREDYEEDLDKPTEFDNDDGSNDFIEVKSGPSYIYIILLVVCFIFIVFVLPKLIEEHKDK